MKKTLRKTGIRTQNLFVESNLRGLGTTEILDNHAPIPYLVVRNLPHESVKGICENHQLQVREFHGDLLFHANFDTQFKTAHLNLFVTALSIHADFKDTSQHLCEQNMMRTLLEANLNTETFSQPSSLRLDGLEQPQMSASITMSPLAQLVVEQSGVHLEISSELLHLDHSYIQRIEQQLKKDATASHQSTKSGTMHT